MKSKITEHLLSIVFVSAIMICIALLVGAGSNADTKDQQARMNVFGDLSFVQSNDPFHKALLKDVMNVYYPDRYDTNLTMVNNLLEEQQRKFGQNLQKSYIEEKLSPRKLGQLCGMYAKFLIVYIIVMLLTYYAVQTIAVFRFVYKKGYAGIRGRTFSARLLRILAKVCTISAYAVLFAPAYVIAYSIRTEFNTDTIVFMALLGVVSNGLLVTYMNKFYAFLISESRKGYVDTALVKNLHAGYRFGDASGISWRSVFHPVKHFPGHILEHIFANARHQYLATVKEQASFLITGLVIIEMALNIHGHISYELMRQLLYKNYDIVLVIVLGIFYTVKGTEMFVDWMMWREEQRYGNK